MHVGEFIKLLYFEGFSPEFADVFFSAKPLWFFVHAGLRVGYSFALWVAAVWGFRLWKGRTEAVLLAYPIVYTLGIYVWFHTAQRFTVPVTPFILMFATFALTRRSHLVEQ